EWRLGIDTNLSGTFYCCRAAIPHMLKQGGGKIINVTSGFGLRGNELMAVSLATSLQVRRCRDRRRAAHLFVVKARVTPPPV
ncbi:MAG: SDR family NAD(P)-dependent oxidoreductase, partial [Dehalococcoidia bacterium]